MSLIFLSIALFTGYHSFNNYDDIDFGNAVEIEHIYSPKVRLLSLMGEERNEAVVFIYVW